MLIGGKIRELRLKNGLTQEELANRCDLSKSFISQLESDTTSTSLATLEDILTCLGSSFESFFGGTRYDKIVYTKNDQTVKVFDGYSIEWLVSDAQNNDMEPIILTLASSCRTPDDDPHGGEEFGFVMSGSVNVHLGAASHHVKCGESFCFEPSTNHYLENTGKTEAKVLWISTPPSF